MHTNKSESQCGSVWQTDGTCGIWGSRLDAVQRPGSRETESTRRMTGVWGKRETQKARGRDGAPGSLPCLCLQQKAIVWCDRRPSASNQASSATGCAVGKMPDADRGLENLYTKENARDTGFSPLTIRSSWDAHRWAPDCCNKSWIVTQPNLSLMFFSLSLFRMQPTWSAKYKMPTAMCALVWGANEAGDLGSQRHKDMLKKDTLL